MNRIFAGFLMLFLFAGCSKDAVIQEQREVPQQVTLKNPNISIINISAMQTGTNQVTFRFSTEYEIDIASIELLNGADDSFFCQIYESKSGKPSTKLKHYVIVDNEAKAPLTYYLIKYTTTAGDWYCSSIFSVEVK